MYNTISINPTRLAAFHKVSFERRLEISLNSRQNLGLNHKKGTSMSAAAKKRLKNAINWMVYLSPKRTIHPKGRKPLKNFSISFVTLTLPGKQMHSHKEIKARCLNNFFNVIRAKFGVKNYVWKAELQKNGNIHFHITLDKWIHYMAIRRIWNSSIELLGYVSRYALNFSRMDFKQYREAREMGGATDIEQIRSAFNYGQATQWQNPNSSDVKKVENVKNLAAYLSKYLAKEITGKEKTGIIADSADSFEGRKWFLSQSLSRLKSVQLSYSYKNIRYLKKLKKLSSSLTFEGDFFECIYFSFTKLKKALRVFLNEELTAYAINLDYPFPAGFPGPRK